MTNHVLAHRINLHLNGMEQPHPDSIIRVGGDRGTVYQRFVSDGLWHGANGQVRNWTDLISKPLYVEVMHSAPLRMEVGSIYVTPHGDVFLIKGDGSHECVRHAGKVTIAQAWVFAKKVFSPDKGILV